MTTTREVVKQTAGFPGRLIGPYADVVGVVKYQEPLTRTFAAQVFSYKPLGVGRTVFTSRYTKQTSGVKICLLNALLACCWYPDDRAVRDIQP